MKMTNDKGKYSQYLTVAGNYFANKGWVHLLLAGGLYILYKMFFRTSLPFFLTKGNREAAKKYGIFMGASHCEPMACNAAGEWKIRGKGAYDYVNNSPAVYQFWEDRVKEVAGQEILYTLGMRGVHDGKMQGAKTVEEQKAVLDRVFVDQRGLLEKYVNKDVTQVPQVFIPYKEVLDIYHAGLQVPEDVTLMWCDDNYGYIRHFPMPKSVPVKAATESIIMFPTGDARTIIYG